MSSYCLESIKNKITFLLLIELIKCLTILPQMLNKQNILGDNFLYFSFFMNNELLIPILLLRFFHCICVFLFLNSFFRISLVFKKRYLSKILHLSSLKRWHPVSVPLHAVIPFQMRDFVSAFVKSHEVPVSPFF